MSGLYRLCRCDDRGQYPSMCIVSLFRLNHPTTEQELRECCETTVPEKAELVFVDIDTFYQKMWPNPSPYLGNTVREKCHRRWFDPSSIDIWEDTVKKYINSNKPRLLRSQKFVFLQTPNRFEWHRVYTDDISVKAAFGSSKRLRQAFPNVNLTVVGFDLTKREILPGDLNLIQPLTTPMVPTELDLLKIKQQKFRRKYLAGFRGKRSTLMRQKIFDFNASKNSSIFIDHSNPRTNNNEDQIQDYKKLLSNFVFGLAPRGDAHYSFRLGELLAYGIYCMPYFLNSHMQSIRFSSCNN